IDIEPYGYDRQRVEAGEKKERTEPVVEQRKTPYRRIARVSSSCKIDHGFFRSSPCGVNMNSERNLYPSTAARRHDPRATCTWKGRLRRYESLWPLQADVARFRALAH